MLFVYIGSLWQPLENLFVMVLPLGALSRCRFDHIERAYHRASTDFGDGLLAHVLISLLAYTALAMAAGQSIILALQERSLRSEELDRFRETAAAVTNDGDPAVSTVVGGTHHADVVHRQRLLVSHRHVRAVGGVAHDPRKCVVGDLCGRTARRDVTHSAGAARLATRATLVGFTLLVFAYFGSKFVIEILLGKH